MAQTSAQKCYICTDKYSVFYCYDCQHALCAVCRERHDKIPAVSGHTITDINGIDLSNVNSDKSRCVTHEKEYLYYCAKCSDLICGKCVTSSHKGHSFSEISEIVPGKREAAQIALQKLKSQINNISSLKDSVRAKHTEKLHNASHQNIADIISTCDDLETFIKSKRDIKKTEVEDNESIEQQCIDQFLKNTDRIHDQYVQVLTELQNVLCEKHDTTFYKLYTAIDKDITCLDDIPKEPTFPTVPFVDKKMLCKEILEYIQSKTDMR
ncbi:tripartite motif-containing protein 5-like [Mytilus edulis]|uniref:tripartite motif-containing protein 5-like n=1 Tax=Mytilus edulis TaxID=6550 RepID=UPI0039EE2FD6